MKRNRSVLVTGASSGIGREVCRQLAEEGHTVHAVARRSDRLEALAVEYPGVRPWVVDLNDEMAVGQLPGRIGEVDDVVHAAGGARGADPVVSSNSDHWSWMWRTNVLGTMRLLRGFAPHMADRGSGTIVVVTSVAAFQCVEGSAGYSASKHAQSAIVQTLRNELLGSGVRVTEIAPGLVDTEFFARRFPDDPGRASEIFRGIDPLTPEDIAGSIRHVLDQPDHVNIDRIVLRPTAQGPNGKVHRR